MVGWLVEWSFFDGLFLEKCFSKLQFRCYNYRPDDVVYETVTIIDETVTIIDRTLSFDGPSISYFIHKIGFVFRVNMSFFDRILLLIMLFTASLMIIQAADQADLARARRNEAQRIRRARTRAEAGEEGAVARDR